MDPTSVIGTIVGVLSFGIQVCDGLVQYCRAWKGYNDDIKSMQETLTGLLKSLAVLKAVIQKPNTFSTDILERVQEHMTALNTSLLKLDNYLKKIQGVEHY